MQTIDEVEIEKSRINFIIWLIPLLALIVGGWLLYDYYSKIGPLITITFKNSGGLEPKVSNIKYRDVKIGVVEKVEILKKSEGVKVYARIHKDAEPFLNSTTKFWIVKPEIGLGKVKGLDALMSGSYIQMYAKLGNKLKKKYKGYDDTPNNLEKMDGDIYELVSKSSFDLRSGSVLYYKGAVAGNIKSVTLSKNGKIVKIYIFVKKNYAKFINSTTKFYNTKNFSVSMADYGINVEVGSLSQILFGGVEFYTKNLTKKDSKKVKNFYLYPNKDVALNKKLGLKREKYVDFKLKFKKGVGYLSIGSLVKLDGFKVGEVKDIVSYYDVNSLKINSYVIASIDISAFESDNLSAFKGLKLAIKNGLHARLDEVNPLISSLYINLVKTNDSETLIKGKKYYIFPTTLSSMSSISSQINSLVTKLSKININKAVDSFSSTLQSVKRPLHDMLTHLDELLKTKDTKELPKNITKSLQKINDSLKSIKKLSSSYDKDSNFANSLNKTLKDIDKSSLELKKVLNKINKKPNALILGD